MSNKYGPRPNGVGAVAWREMCNESERQAKLRRKKDEANAKRRQQRAAAKQKELLLSAAAN